MKQTRWLVSLILMAATAAAAAQSSASAANSEDETANPVARVRKNMSWEYGPFANWGTGVGDRASYKFFWAGFQLGKPLTPILHAGIFSGQFELGGNIMPLWQAYTPAPHQQEYTCGTPSGQTVNCLLQVGGGTFYGISLTPVILRWNFLTRSRHIQPWFQGAGGLIYTTHKFPPNILSSPTINGGTSVWNFSPQGGAGAHFFIAPKRSIDVGVNAVHISSASLGDRNPGVNASIQIQVGYTFWK
ncbi:MAG TPA: acyloxyacyl hydrolase [Terracidiphilus sp.]